MRLVIALLLTFFVGHAVAAEPVRAVPDSKVPIWVMTDSNSNVVSLQLRFLGGVSQDPAGKAGVGVLMTDIIQRGAGDRNSAAFAHFLRDNAIVLSVDMGRDETIVRMTAPAERWQEASQSLNDVLKRPNVDSDEIARAKEETLAVLRDQMSDPNWKAQRLANGLVYQGTPYALPGSGTTSTVSNITRADILAAHDRVFAHRPLGAVFVGAADTELARRFLQPFVNLPKAPREKLADYRQLKKPRNVFHAYAVPQTTLIYVLPGLARNDPQFPALAVLDALLADGFGSRLMKEFREDSGLSYGIGSSLGNADHGPIWQFDVQVPANRAGEAADRMRKIIGETAKTRFSENELKKARESLASSFAMGWVSSPAIASQLTAAQHDELGANYLEDWQNRLRAVTVQDVQRVAARLTPETKGLMIAVGASEPDSGWETIETLPGTQ